MFEAGGGGERSDLALDIRGIVVIVVRVLGVVLRPPRREEGVCNAAPCLRVSRYLSLLTVTYRSPPASVCHRQRWCSGCLYVISCRDSDSRWFIIPIAGG